MKNEFFELEIGYKLIKLADPSQGGDLLEQMQEKRKKIALEFNILIAKITIRDNLQLQPYQYEIKLNGITIGCGEVYPDKLLAVEIDSACEKIEGIKTKDLKFGHDAVWIDFEKNKEAILKGYNIVGSSTVLATHLFEQIKNHYDNNSC